MLLFGGLAALAGLASLLIDLQASKLLPLAAFVSVAVLGVARLVQARRKRMALEELHGKDAGKQQSVR